MRDLLDKALRPAVFGHVHANAVAPRCLNADGEFVDIAFRMFRVELELARLLVALGQQRGVRPVEAAPLLLQHIRDRRCPPPAASRQRQAELDASHSSRVRHVQQLHLERQRRVGGDHAARASGSVGHVWWDCQLALAANFHARDPYVPATNHLLLAEVEGEDALYSDLRARLFMTEEEAKANYENSPDWLKELCDAFADGINYYLHTHPEVKPKLLTHFEPWMPMYFSEGSIGGDIERISTRKIKSFYESGMELPKMEALQIKKEEEMAEPQGSNGIAISGDLTESGNAMLLINPHTSFYFRGEVHVVSEEGLNAYGAVTWGQFFVYQGFNEKTGWMHTSTYTDVMDEFKETIVKNDGKLFYQYGEELRPVDSSSVTLKYKDGESIKEKTFPMYRTHHGPITHQVDDQWTASAMMWEPVKALEQSYIRTKQDGYEGFREMMDIRTNSSNNTVYADAEGNIAYFHGNFVPKRDTIFDYTQPVDGSNPKTDWQGLHTVDENILVLFFFENFFNKCPAETIHSLLTRPKLFVLNNIASK